MTSKRPGHATSTLADRHWYASARNPPRVMSRAWRARLSKGIPPQTRTLAQQKPRRLQPANRVFAASRGKVPLHYKKIRNFWPNSQITHRVAVDSLADRRNQLTDNTLQALHQTSTTNQATSSTPSRSPGAPTAARRPLLLRLCQPPRALVDAASFG